MFKARNTNLGLNDALSRKIAFGGIPAGCVSVPLTVDDNGTEYKTTMVAGLVSIQANSREIKGGTGQADALVDYIQPLSGWFMFENKDTEEEKKKKKKKRRLRDC